jgi:hypothetical protein
LTTARRDFGNVAARTLHDLLLVAQGHRHASATVGTRPLLCVIFTSADAMLASPHRVLPHRGRRQGAVAEGRDLENRLAKLGVVRFGGGVQFALLPYGAHESGPAHLVGSRGVM